ncbi:MAG: hypothetical protein HIU84_07625 [Acidobacteria bacterium]|nr:hypothetical protein [Acidobacteriota bacterium]
MTDITLTSGSNSDVEAADEIVQHKWDRFVAGDNVSLDLTIPFPSRVAKTALANWANETFEAVDTTKVLSDAIAKVQSTDLCRHVAEGRYATAFTQGSGDQSRSNHDEQVGDSIELHEQRS